MFKTKIYVLLILIIFIVACPFVVACNDQAKTDNLYTVTFKDYDGRIIKEYEVEKGGTVEPPNEPIRKGYEFVKWDKDFSIIKNDITIYPQYATVKNQLFFDYKAQDDTLVVTLSLCGDVEVCGLEATLGCSKNNVNLMNVVSGQNANISEINFIEQSNGNIKFFFFHDQIENINEEIDILIFTFDGLSGQSMLEFDLNVTVFVDKNFEPVAFNVANNVYKK